MGLFTNKQKLCPICNGPTPRIFPTQIEGMPICKECNNKVDLPDGMINQMSLERFRQYMDFYNQNKALRDIFAESYRVGFADYNSVIILDAYNRLFRLKEAGASLVMEAANLVSFRILEDNMPLFEWKGDTLRCHSSKVPALVESLAPQITQFRMQREMYEQLERMERERERREREKNGESTESSYYESSPTFNVPVPFKYFYVELTLTHPYWNGFRGKMAAPGFSQYNPSVSGYMYNYQIQVEQLHMLAVELMHLINPAAKEISDADKEDKADNAPAPAQTKTIADVANEIKKYKALLDSGIITEEEFTAKKRQLLGI